MHVSYNLQSTHIYKLQLMSGLTAQWNSHKLALSDILTKNTQAEAELREKSALLSVLSERAMDKDKLIEMQAQTIESQKVMLQMLQQSLNPQST